MLTESELKHIMEKSEAFSGQITSLESAIGAVFVGKVFGWRVLRMAHGANTIKKYEEILGLKYSDICPERTENTKRSVGMRIADSIGRYWDVVMGRYKVDGKANLDEGKD